jgi:hypothetical protein
MPGENSSFPRDGARRNAVIIITGSFMPKTRSRMIRPPDDFFPPKKRKAIPHEFVLDALASVSPRTNPMFGCLAVYVPDVHKHEVHREEVHMKEKIVLILRDRPTAPADNGVWLATTVEHHESLRADFPSLRSIGVLGKDVTGWQILPADSPDFEEAALRACEFVLARDPRIGKVPKAKRSKQDQPKEKAIKAKATKPKNETQQSQVKTKKKKK